MSFLLTLERKKEERGDFSQEGENTNKVKRRMEGRVDRVRIGAGGTRRCLLNRRDQYDVFSCNSNSRICSKVCSRHQLPFQSIK